MQSCWLPPSQRPSAPEIFLLLSSLLAAEWGLARRSVGEEDEEDEEHVEGRGRRGESEESFERRWNLLRPPAFQAAANERRRNRELGREDRDNSYPLLDPVGNCTTLSSSELDDILTVTETSKGLNFEYFWEKAHARRGYKPLPPPQQIPTVNNNHRQNLDTPTVVPVISARSPSLASEYYIRLEEHTPQDKSPTLKGKVQSSLRSDSVCSGDVELVEIRSGMLGKERVPYCSSEKSEKTLYKVRSSEVQRQVPKTGVAEFRDTSSRVTDFSVVDLGDDVEAENKTSSGADKKCPATFQAPLLPPKPRSMSMSSSNHLHPRPLPAPPLGYRGLPHYTVGGKIETDPHHTGSCPPSTLDHLGFHRSRQALPPSPSLSPSIPPSNHPIYPQMCPPPLPPHSKPQRCVPSYNTDSRYSKPQMQRFSRDPLSCDMSENDSRHAASLHPSKEASYSRTKDFDSPIRRQNPLRPIYRNPPHPQPSNTQIDRQSSSSPTYSDEDDSPFMSPERPCSGTTVTHSSLSEDADPGTAELFSRGMKRTQSRLDTILPAIWREDAELHTEHVVAAKKSPMHLFLTEISSVTESTEAKPEEEEEKKDGERWGNVTLPSKGMRRSQSLITELSSAGQSWGQEVHVNRTEAEEDGVVTDESFQKDLFLTEVDTERIDIDINEGSESDSVKYLYPAGSRLRPYVCIPGREPEETSTKGIRRSRSLLTEITVEKQESEIHKPPRPEMTREEFLKEIQSAETFLTEIISRQTATTNRMEPDPSNSPTPLSPEYESLCFDPDSTQTIRFQTESSIRASTKGKDDTQTEAIYAQVTKRAKKSEIKVSIRPKIPKLHIGSNNQPLILDSQENKADHCQSDEFVFSEIMPKNGLLHNQTLKCEKEEEEEECSDGPALPARGALTDLSPSESTESGVKSSTVMPHENKPVIMNQTETAAVIENGGPIKDNLQVCGPEAGGQTEGQSGGVQDNTSDKTAGSESMDFCNNKNFADTDGENDANQIIYNHITQKEPVPSVSPSTPEWNPSSDVSLVTPTDSVLSPLTSSSADGLTPSDSWTGGGGCGWRALGNETPHRDSAYFSDSDWEGDGTSKRSSGDGLASRPSGGRGGERGILTEIEENTEEEGEASEKSPLRTSLHTSSIETRNGEETIEVCENVDTNDRSLSGDEKDTLNKGLKSTQRDDSGIFHNESNKSALPCDDLDVEDCVDFIDKLFSKLDDEPLKALSQSGGFVIDGHYTAGIVSKITDYKYSDESSLTLCFKSPAETSDLTISKTETSVPVTEKELTAPKSLKSGNEPESRLSELWDVRSGEGRLRGETHSKGGVELLDNKVCLGVEERVSLDQNELGLRNLLCSEKEDTEVLGEEETNQKGLNEKPPASRETSTSDPNKNMSNNSCEQLDVMSEGWWNALEEDEETPGSGVVGGGLVCLVQLGDLHSWPDQNNQWASPEKRCQEVEPRSEFYPRNKEWPAKERLVVGEENWDSKENDELAGSEPHPAVLEKIWTNETLSDNLTVREAWSSNGSASHQTAADIQQEENIENLEEIENFKRSEKQLLSDTEVENVETPEDESLVKGEDQVLSCMEGDMEENQNFNRWPENHLCSTRREDQTSALHDFSHASPNKSSDAPISITEASRVNCSDQVNDASGFTSEAEVRQLAQQCTDEGVQSVEEEYREMPFGPSTFEALKDSEPSYPEVDNFSSVDFPSPPRSIDLDVQDDKLESLDDSFPSPPPSVIEAEDFITHINLEDFNTSTETESYNSPPHNADVSEQPLQELPPAATQNKGISANLNLTSVHITLTDDNNFTSSIEGEHHWDNVSEKTSPAVPSMPQNAQKNIPELLISEWKDLDEEPLEDFEKLEQLCCISGDEGETLGELFLGNLELLESLKKAPDQKGSCTGETEAGDEIRSSSSPEGTKTGEIRNKSNELGESNKTTITDSQDNLSSPAERNDEQRSPEVKDQGCLSKMTTKNGLMMQVSARDSLQA